MACVVGCGVVVLCLWRSDAGCVLCAVSCRIIPLDQQKQGSGQAFTYPLDQQRQAVTESLSLLSSSAAEDHTGDTSKEAGRGTSSILNDPFDQRPPITHSQRALRIAGLDVLLQRLEEIRSGV